MRIPSSWRRIPWYSSPLSRCRETAALLGVADPRVTPLLAETRWGDFEGMTLAEVEAEIRRSGLSPDRGLDLLPPGGESPRQVRQRLRTWLGTLPPDLPALVAVTHKGVIRAAISLATGWDMMSPFPRTVDWRAPLGFERCGEDDLVLHRLNCRWDDNTLLALGDPR